MGHVFSAQLLRIFVQKGDNTNNIVTVTVASMYTTENSDFKMND